MPLNLPARYKTMTNEELCALANKCLLECIRGDQREFTLVSYGEGREFDSEGDMYEYLIGHRSAIIDARERRRVERQR